MTPDKVKAQVKALRVAFLPWWSSRGDECFSNPYLFQLADELKEFGVSVREDSPRVSVKTLFLHRLLGANKVDIAHFHQPDTLVLASGSLLKTRAKLWLFQFQIALVKLLGIGLVWTAHELHSHRFEHPEEVNKSYRCMVRNADAIIVHGPSVKAELLDQFSADSEKIHIIPHPSYVGMYPPGLGREASRDFLQLPPEAFVYLFLGNLRAYKGVDDLVRAFVKSVDAADSDTNARFSKLLLIAGAPENAGLRDELIQAIGGREDIRFDSTAVAAELIGMYMDSADVVVLPFRKVTTSGSLLLAMSFGKACIAPRLGCLPDVINSEGGFLYAPGAENALTEALEQAVQLRDRLPAMGHYNRQRVAEWTWARMAEQTSSIYKAIVSR